MPPKKKEAKTEEPAFVDEEGTFIHEAEMARYKGGVRRFNTPGELANAPTTTGKEKSGRGASKEKEPSTTKEKNAAAAAAAAAAVAVDAQASSTPVMRYRHGHGTYVSREIRYVGQWVEDAMHGEGHIEFLRSGNVYDGSFSHGKFDGHGVYVWGTGERYEGAWRDSRMHGQGIFVDGDGNTWKGKYYNGVGPGLERLYHAGAMQDAA